MKTQIVPVVTGASGSMPKDLEHWLDVLGIKHKINHLQKLSSNILQEFSEMSLS